MKTIDLRSDTVTRPTEAMRLAMAEAEVGDDVYGEDPTINQLEELAARILGKEAAVFVPSGTMGNQVSIMAWTRPGDEIIAGAACHVVQNEAGGAARLSGVGCALVAEPMMGPEDVERLVRPRGNVHYPRSRLVCLENALGDGRVMSLERMEAIYQSAHRHELLVHLDGARLFNAAVALKVSAREIADHADSVSVCLSKGLCAPVGSLVCGPADFAAEVRRCRKVLGGGLRQAGVLAACGLIALCDMTKRLDDDHENARHLGRMLAEIPGVLVEPENIDINMVFWEPASKSFNDQSYVAFMAESGIKVGGPSGGRFRLVTHNDVSRADVEFYVDRLRVFMG